MGEHRGAPTPKWDPIGVDPQQGNQLRSNDPSLAELLQICLLQLRFSVALNLQMPGEAANAKGCMCGVSWATARTF